MPEKIAQKPQEIDNRLMEFAQQTTEEKKQLHALEPKEKQGLAKKLGKLKPLLPVLAGGLRLIDHGAAQALAHLFHLADGGGGSASAQAEIQHGLAEIEASHRDLRLSVQDHSVELKRVEEQITLLRQTAERNASDHAELVEDVKSLGNLVRTIGAGLGILLILLLVLVGMLLARGR